MGSRQQNLFRFFARASESESADATAVQDAASTCHTSPPDRSQADVTSVETRTLGSSNPAHIQAPPRPVHLATVETCPNAENVDVEMATETSGFLWSAAEVSDAAKEMWPSQRYHSYFTCGGLCDSVSKTEKDRLKSLEEEKKKQNKKPDKFKHEWLLKKRYWPFCYVEMEGFYCLVCKKHNVKNTQNKTQPFVHQPATRYKEHTLKSHLETDAHLAAVEADIIQQKSFFHKMHVQKKTVEKSVLHKAFYTAYFLMKEYIANRKFIPFLNFMEKIIGVKDLEYFNHRSQGSVRDIFMCIGGTVKESLLEKACKANSYGIMIDEVTDISVTSQLVTFIQFWDRESHSVQTLFLASQNVLQNFESCNADAISCLVKSQLQECNLNIEKLMGLSTDGASVMLGKNNGVAAKLREDNGKLINIHCVCHRLALACTDTCSDLSGIKQAEDVLKQLWYYFQNSPKQMASFLKTQLALKAALQPSETTVKFLSRRLKKACQTRWLSFDNSVSAALRDYEAILLTLQHLDDATATGLLTKMKTVKFLGILYILKSVLPILSMLSRQFQAGQFHFSMVKPATSRAVAALKEIKESKEPVDQLQANIESFTKISDDICFRKDDEKQLKSLLDKYIDKLTENVTDRLGNASEIIGAYGVFDPLSIPHPTDDNFQSYGSDEMKLLANHFWPGDKDREDKLQCQWSQSKYYIANKQIKVPSGSQSCTFFMCHILKNEGIFHPSMFTELLFVVEVGISLPCSNAWPERGGSIIKVTKTKSRNRLANEMLNPLMHVSINGPGMPGTVAKSSDKRAEAEEKEKCEQLIQQSVDNWLGSGKSKRKKLKRKYEEVVTGVDTKATAEQQDQEMQGETESMEQEEIQRKSEHEVQVQQAQEQELASAVGLGESDYDSAIESDYDDSYE